MTKFTKSPKSEKTTNRFSSFFRPLDGLIIPPFLLDIISDVTSEIIGGVIASFDLPITKQQNLVFITIYLVFKLMTRFSRKE